MTCYPPVAIVIGQLGYGGAERQVSILARELAGNRWPVTVICLSEVIEPFGADLVQAGVTVLKIPRSGNYETGRVLRLAGLLRKQRPGLIHSFLGVANIYSYLARTLAGSSRFIPTARTLPVEQTFIAGLLTGRSLKAGAMVHANSRAAARLFA
ncbi:MAG: glycosyltransferase, partial [Gemmatimonadota bacterium]|nr:glycosyltransferase [Gemmatimonadota bacterium]